MLASLTQLQNTPLIGRERLRNEQKRKKKEHVQTNCFFSAKYANLWLFCQHSRRGYIASLLHQRKKTKKKKKETRILKSLTRKECILSLHTPVKRARPEKSSTFDEQNFNSPVSFSLVSRFWTLTCNPLFHRHPIPCQIILFGFSCLWECSKLSTRC